MAKCVLVVDDDRLNTELVKRTLLSKGYEVLTANDGLDAFEVIKKKMPDLILLDVQMPNMDGYTFVMKRTAEIAKIPVIVLSAMGKTEPMFKRHGVKAYLIKPIITQDLIDKVSSILPAA